MTIEVRRARPWLGTIVEIRVSTDSEESALRAIDTAFEEIGEVHRLMSFHDCDSDLTRLNLHGVKSAVRVDRRTHEVLELALHFAAESDGSFDPTVARQLVEWELLPPPAGASSLPDRDASWRDVDLLDKGRVRFSRPLWLDLGGIAKGYAVDRAIDRLIGAGMSAACVNAGGDLRSAGAGTQRIHVRTSPSSIVPAFDISERSVATSSGIGAGRRIGGRSIGPHIDGRRHRATGSRTTVAVVAGRCVVADALTKIVMARPRASEHVLRNHGAIAYTFNASRGWRRLGA